MKTMQYKSKFIFNEIKKLVVPVRRCPKCKNNLILLNAHICLDMEGELFILEICYECSCCSVRWSIDTIEDSWFFKSLILKGDKMQNGK